MTKKILPILLMGAAGLFGNAVVAPSTAYAQNISLEVSAENLSNQQITSAQPGQEFYLVLKATGMPSNNISSFDSFLEYDRSKILANLPSGPPASVNNFNNTSGGNVTSPVSIGSAWQINGINTAGSGALVNDFYEGFQTIEVDIASNSTNSASGDIYRLKVKFADDDPLGATYSINLASAVLNGGTYSYLDPRIGENMNNINVQNLQMAVVPEPKTYTLGAGAGALLVALLARRRKSNLEKTVTGTRGN